MARSAIIAGGGIGGLATALALQREGFEVTVLERRGSRERVAGGAGLMVWHNGTSALARLGIGAEALARASSEIDSFEFRTWRGAHLMRWDVGGLARELGSPAIGINRGDLHAALLDAMAPGTLRLGVECMGFSGEDASDGVRVKLSDGSVRQADVLIGADGINSTIRTALLGRRSPRYAGYTTWRGLLDFPEDLAPAGHARKLWGPGRRFLFYRVGGGQLYWLALNRASAGGLDEPGRAREAVLAHHSGWQSPVPEMIEATPEGAIERLDIADHRPLRRWGAGRVTLLGDAAHAMTPNMGQGACQAIEDAVVLARCLREAGPGAGDVSAALRAYERERRARTAYFQRHSRVTGTIGRWRTAPAVRVRDAMIRFAFNSFATRQHVTEMRTAP